MTAIARRRLLALAAAAAVGTTAAACGTTEGTKASSSAGAKESSGPVTVKHLYGSTTIEGTPSRVAAVSWVNGDTALALGVVPVAMPKIAWGGNKAGSNDWTDAKLEELKPKEAPDRYDDTKGVNVDAIAAAEPDLIIAAYSGLTKEEYERLTKIAPTIGPLDANFSTPWQDSTVAIGQALRKDAEAKRLVADTEARIDKAAKANPDLAGTTFIAGNLDPEGGALNIYTKGDNRSRMLTALGMREAPYVEAHAPKNGAFFYDVSPERGSEVDSQVFFTWLPTGMTVDTIKKDPLMSRIPAVAHGGLVSTSDEQLILSVSAANPLSIAWGIDKLAALLETGAKAAKSAA